MAEQMVEKKDAQTQTYLVAEDGRSDKEKIENLQSYLCILQGQLIQLQEQRQIYSDQHMAPHDFKELWWLEDVEANRKEMWRLHDKVEECLDKISLVVDRINALEKKERERIGREAEAAAMAKSFGNMCVYTKPKNFGKKRGGQKKKQQGQQHQ